MSEVRNTNYPWFAPHALCETLGRLLWHKFDGRRSRFRYQHGINVAWVVTAIFRTQCSVELVIDAGVSFLYEGNIFLHATGLDMPLVARLRTAKPTAAPSSD